MEFDSGVLFCLYPAYKQQSELRCSGIVLGGGLATVDVSSCLKESL